MTVFRSIVVILGVALILGFGAFGPTASLAETRDRSGWGNDPGDPTDPEDTGNWLEHLNWYRSLAGQPALVEDEGFSYGCTLHAIYMAKNNILIRPEDPNNEWYTAEGHAAGLNSNVFISNELNGDIKVTIDQWMEGPFTAVGILDPELATTGYGEHRESNKDQYTQWAAALDVISGMSGSGPTPVFWPGNGSTTPIGIYEAGRDYPNPLTHCPGYEDREITGPGLIVQTSTGFSDIPEITDSSIVNGKGISLEHCVFHEGNYTNPDLEDQEYGRQVLSFRDAVIIMPRLPFERGETYSVSITINGQVYSWS
jgi:hypothetical protein